MSEYLLANSELLRNTIDKKRMGVGPVLVAQDVLAQWSGLQHPGWVALSTEVVDCTGPNNFLVPAQCLLCNWRWDLCQCVVTLVFASCLATATG